jgi:cell division septum initiation protein DivIVA
MEDLNTEIKRLQEMLHVLIKRYKQLQKENEHLKKQNEEFKKHLLQKDILVQDAQQKSTAVNIASLHNNDEKKILQHRIDLYLKDIEKCLSLLNV